MRDVEGGLDEVRDVLAGRCSFSTSSINSSLLQDHRGSCHQGTPHQDAQAFGTSTAPFRRCRPHATPWVVTFMVTLEGASLSPEPKVCGRHFREWHRGRGDGGRGRRDHSRRTTSGCAGVQYRVGAPVAGEQLRRAADEFAAGRGGHRAEASGSDPRCRAVKDLLYTDIFFILVPTWIDQYRASQSVSPRIRQPLCSLSALGIHITLSRSSMRDCVRQKLFYVDVRQDCHRGCLFLKSRILNFNSALILARRISSLLS